MMKPSQLNYGIGVGLFCLITTVTSVAWDSACGVTKGCFPNCQSSGCSYLVTWDDTGSAVNFELKYDTSATSQWLALAFSSDYRMGDDSVVGCISDDSTVKSYFNEGTDTDVLDPTTLGLSSPVVSLNNGLFTCTFTRSLTESHSKYFDITKDWIIHLGIGEVEAEDGSYKMEHHYMIPHASATAVDFQSNTIVELKKLNGALVKLHGIMMVLAWLLFTVVGIITARYNKDLLPEQKLLGTKVWFQVHRGSMVAAVLFVVIGFIPIFVEVEGYSQITPPESQSFVKSHPVLGIIIFCLTIINPIMGLIRPGPDHKFRPLFNWAHLGVGVVGQVIAVITVFFGYVLERSGLKNNIIYATIFHLVVVTIVVIVMEVYKFQQLKKARVADGDKEGVVSNGDLTMEKKPVESKSNLPMIVLAVATVALFAGTLGLLGVIAAS